LTCEWSNEGLHARGLTQSTPNSQLPSLKPTPNSQLPSLKSTPNSQLPSLKPTPNVVAKRWGHLQLRNEGAIFDFET